MPQIMARTEEMLSKAQKILGWLEDHKASNDKMMCTVKEMPPSFSGTYPGKLLQNILNMKTTYQSLHQNLEEHAKKILDAAAAYDEAERVTTNEVTQTGASGTGTGAVLSNNPQASSISHRPVQGGSITSRHGDGSGDSTYNNGEGHHGVDVALPQGESIVAAVGGTVLACPNDGESHDGYGNYVKILGDDGNTYYYAHMHNTADGLSEGSRVEAGTLIGYVGTTGNSTGNHLHFEVRDENKRQLDPSELFPGLF